MRGEGCEGRKGGGGKRGGGRAVRGSGGRKLGISLTREVKEEGKRGEEGNGRVRGDTV